MVWLVGYVQSMSRQGTSSNKPSKNSRSSLPGALELLPGASSKAVGRLIPLLQRTKRQELGRWARASTRPSRAAHGPRKNFLPAGVAPGAPPSKDKDGN